MKTLIALLSVILFAPALAADTGALRGIVHDPQHRPLPGAQVVLRGPGSTITTLGCAETRLNTLFRTSDISHLGKRLRFLAKNRTSHYLSK